MSVFLALPPSWVVSNALAFAVRDGFPVSPRRDVGFREESRGANVWLVVPNDEGVFDGAGRVGGVACVHLVRAYVDLLGQPERAAEAAGELRPRFIPRRVVADCFSAIEATGELRSRFLTWKD